MPPYDESYHRQGSYYPSRPQRRWRSYRAAPSTRMYDSATGRYRTTGRYPSSYPSPRTGRYLPYPRFGGTSGYDDDFGEYRSTGAVGDLQARMGMRDFSERYGRYSGGSPYSYEYSERTIYHTPRYGGPIGFTRPLGKTGYDTEYGRARREMARFGYRRGYSVPAIHREARSPRSSRDRGRFRPYTRWGGR